MATYAELSPEDQAIVDNTVNLIRAASGQLAKVFLTMSQIELDTNATGLVVSIDPGATIPNTSGLAGSDDMTRSELVGLWMQMLALKNDATNGYDQIIDNILKAAGINSQL